MITRSKRERGTIATILSFVLLVAWLVGIVIAKGFWMVFAAVVIPPYSWYLVVEKVLLVNGWL